MSAHVHHSLAAQAVAAGPPTLAPPSFEGNNALYILNLFVFFAGTELFAMLWLKLGIDTLLCAVAPEDMPADGRWWRRELIAARVRLRWPWATRAVVGLTAGLLRVLGPDRKPDADDWRSPIMLWRRIGLLVSTGFVVRCFSEMQSLWRWYPLDPAGTGRALALKRILDPIAFGFGGAGMLLFYLSLPGITAQLRKEPFPIDMWTAVPLLKRPAGVVLCCLGAAVAVVVFR